MTEDARYLPGENLRQAMRRWVTGVTIVTSKYDGICHGMTVNSFVSISLDPPQVCVTLANNTRTFAMVKASNVFGVTVLDHGQAHLSDIFAGHVPDGNNRFAGVETFSLSGGIPLISGGLSALECQVVHEYAVKNSTLFVGEVQVAWNRDDGEPLIYYNRTYHRIEK